MSRQLLPEPLWHQVQPLLPEHPPHPRGGNQWADDRLCLRGIIFVLRTGIQWQMLPTEAFGVSGSTCWRRLRDWTDAGLWPAIHQRIVHLIEDVGGIDHSFGIVDSQSVRAVKGGRTPAPTRPTAANAAANATS